jgi:hypothetical protein
VRTQTSTTPRASTKATLSPDDVKPMRLPKAPADGPWHPEAVAWWRSMAASGVVAGLLEHERLNLPLVLRLRHRMLLALDDPKASPSALNRMGSELRTWEIALGLVPRARASLSWTVTEAKPKRRLASVSTITGEMSDAEHAELVRAARARAGEGTG